MLNKCEFCRERVRPVQMNAHLKRCPKARRAAKLKHNKSITQTLEYRQKTLSQFVVTQDYNLKLMSDNEFNELISRLEHIKKQREEKEKQIDEKKQQRIEKMLKTKAEKEEQKKKNDKKKALEAKAQELQIKKEEENLKDQTKKKKNLEKAFAKQRKTPKPKSEEGIIKDEIKIIDELQNNTLNALKPEEVND